MKNYVSKPLLFPLGTDPFRMSGEQSITVCALSFGFLGERHRFFLH